MQESLRIMLESEDPQPVSADIRCWYRVGTSDPNDADADRYTMTSGRGTVCRSALQSGMIDIVPDFTPGSSLEPLKSLSVPKVDPIEVRYDFSDDSVTHNF